MDRVLAFVDWHATQQNNIRNTNQLSWAMDEALETIANGNLFVDVIIRAPLVESFLTKLLRNFEVDWMWHCSIVHCALFHCALQITFSAAFDGWAFCDAWDNNLSFDIYHCFQLRSRDHLDCRCSNGLKFIVVLEQREGWQQRVVCNGESWNQR